MAGRGRHRRRWQWPGREIKEDFWARVRGPSEPLVRATWEARVKCWKGSICNFIIVIGNFTTTTCNITTAVHNFATTQGNFSALVSKIIKLIIRNFKT
jgi:hypothetical protein